MLLQKIIKPPVLHLGIIGGMGPLASAGFVRTIYKLSVGKEEQQKLKLSLISDPSIPDRTDFFLRGNSDLLLKTLLKQIVMLKDMGATHIVICCITIHYLLPRLPVEFSNCIVSLVDILIKQIKYFGKKPLILCTSGTKQLELLEKHPKYKEIKNIVQFLLPIDQQKLHDAIYFFKKKLCA